VTFRNKSKIVTSGVSTQKVTPMLICCEESVTIRGSHAFLAVVSEAGPLAMEVKVFEVVSLPGHRAPW